MQDYHCQLGYQETLQEHIKLQREVYNDHKAPLHMVT
jgi:hypothetical protein